MDVEFLKIVNSHKSDDKMIPITDVEEQHRMFARMKARAAKKK